MSLKKTEIYGIRNDSGVLFLATKDDKYYLCMQDYLNDKDDISYYEEINKELYDALISWEESRPEDL